MHEVDRLFPPASSIASQQRRVIMLACSIVLVLTLFCFLSYIYLSFSLESRQHLVALSDIVGADVGAALAFGDDQAVSKSLAALRADPSVKQLFVLNAQGQVSAYYGMGANQVPVDLQQRLSTLRSELRQHLIDLDPELERPIIRDGERLGSVLIEQSEHVLLSKIHAAAAIGTFILLLALAFSYLLAGRFQRIITTPVTAMAATMREVSQLKDYTQRVAPAGPDELVQLALNFNAMLGEIERRDAALQESERKWKFAIEGSGAGVWDWNLQTDEVKCSPLCQEMVGYAEDDIVPTGQEWVDRIHPDDRGHAADARKRYLDGESDAFIVEYRLRCKDGSYKWILNSGTVVSFSEDGRPLRMIGTHTDITDRKMHEKELLKMEKLESLGVLAGGIAHDFNNILTGIMGNLSLAQMCVDSSHESFKPLAEAEKASERAGALAQQLLTFARGGTPVKKLVSIRHIVNESLSLVLRGSNVKGHVDIPPSIHAIEADEGQMIQVINNVVLNAAQAMPSGGALTVAAQNETLDDKNPFSIPSGTYVRLTFTDHGCGISEENLTRIFDPYFSTKPKGNGLGLASVYSIVRRHSGHISVSSAVDKGTTFTILLPSIGKEYPSHHSASITQAAHDRATVPILVMDDEEFIRNLATTMLQRLGYQVTTCGDGAEAIALYQEAMASGTPFALIIMDLTIPGGMGGEEAAGRILALDPKACLVVSSGYSNDPIMSEFRSYGFSGSLAKPYKTAELSQVLASILPA